MSEAASSRLRYCVHGPGLEITCQTPQLLEPLNDALSPFQTESLIGRGSPIRGIIRPFDSVEVRRHLSPTATRVTSANELLELYEEDERFWLIDDHWGLCEINLLKAQWRSWIVPTATADTGRIVEQAVLWPLAQLLRARGVQLIPAASVVRDGWGVLLLSTFSLEPELTALVRAGFRIVGQSWTALQEQGGRVWMLQMPGRVQRAGSTAGAVDLIEQFCGSACPRATCDAVMLVAAGRRPLPHLRGIAPTNAIGAMRRAWPVTELHPQRRQGQMPARLAHRCRIFDVQLSRNAKDILSLVETARYARPQTPHAPVVAERVVA